MAFTKETSIKTYYESTGEGEALIFVHGLGSSSQDWEYQLPFFREHFQVITYDVRGHGQSEKAKPPYSVPLFAKDLAELLDELGIEKAHIVGVSMGGWIAFQFGLDYPERTLSLTVINTWADMRLKTLEDWKNYFQRAVLFRLFSMRKIGEVLSEKLFIKPEQGDLRKRFVESWAKNHKPSYMASFQAGIGWTVHDKLEKFTLPVLVVAADEDYTPVSMKEEYAKQLPNARLAVIEDSRHATPVEKPEEFNQILLDFLREIK
jgi:3-oxoadipate enol-lactonase